MVRFVQEHVVLFLRLCELGSKECHKATTSKGVPLGGVHDKNVTKELRKIEKQIVEDVLQV